MKTFLKAVLFIATLAMGNAHALCLNADGTPDDPSLVFSAPVDMLPMCQAQAEPAKKAVVAIAAAPAAKVKAKVPDESVDASIPYVYGGE